MGVSYRPPPPYRAPLTPEQQAIAAFHAARAREQARKMPPPMQQTMGAEGVHEVEPNAPQPSPQGMVSTPGPSAAVGPTGRTLVPADQMADLATGAAGLAPAIQARLEMVRDPDGFNQLVPEINKRAAPGLLGAAGEMAAVGGMGMTVPSARLEDAGVEGVLEKAITGGVDMGRPLSGTWEKQTPNVFGDMASAFIPKFPGSQPTDYGPLTPAEILAAAHAAGAGAGMYGTGKVLGGQGAPLEMAKAVPTTAARVVAPAVAEGAQSAVREAAGSREVQGSVVAALRERLKAKVAAELPGVKRVAKDVATGAAHSAATGAVLGGATGAMVGSDSGKEPGLEAAIEQAGHTAAGFAVLGGGLRGLGTAGAEVKGFTGAKGAVSKALRERQLRDPRRYADTELAAERLARAKAPGEESIASDHLPPAFDEAAPSKVIPFTRPPAVPLRPPVGAAPPNAQVAEEPPKYGEQKGPWDAGFRVQREPNGDATVMAPDGKRVVARWHSGELAWLQSSGKLPKNDADRGLVDFTMLTPEGAVAKKRAQSPRVAEEPRKYGDTPPNVLKTPPTPQTLEQEGARRATFPMTAMDVVAHAEAKGVPIEQAVEALRREGYGVTDAMAAEASSVVREVPPQYGGKPSRADEIRERMKANTESLTQAVSKGDRPTADKAYAENEALERELMSLLGEEGSTAEWLRRIQASKPKPTATDPSPPVRMVERNRMRPVPLDPNLPTERDVELTRQGEQYMARDPENVLAELRVVRERMADAETEQRRQVSARAVKWADNEVRRLAPEHSRLLAEYQKITGEDALDALAQRRGQSLPQAPPPIDDNPDTRLYEQPPNYGAVQEQPKRYQPRRIEGADERYVPDGKYGPGHYTHKAGEVAAESGTTRGTPEDHREWVKQGLLDKLRLINEDPHMGGTERYDATNPLREQLRRLSDEEKREAQNLPPWMKPDGYGHVDPAYRTKLVGEQGELIRKIKEATRYGLSGIPELEKRRADIDAELKQLDEYDLQANQRARDNPKPSPQREDLGPERAIPPWSKEGDAAFRRERNAEGEDAAPWQQEKPNAPVPPLHHLRERIYLSIKNPLQLDQPVPKGLMEFLRSELEADPAAREHGDASWVQGGKTGRDLFMSVASMPYMGGAYGAARAQQLFQRLGYDGVVSDQGHAVAFDDTTSVKAQSLREGEAEPYTETTPTEVLNERNPTALRPADQPGTVLGALQARRGRAPASAAANPDTGPVGSALARRRAGAKPVRKGATTDLGPGAELRPLSEPELRKRVAAHLADLDGRIARGIREGKFRPDLTTDSVAEGKRLVKKAQMALVRTLKGFERKPLGPTEGYDLAGRGFADNVVETILENFGAQTLVGQRIGTERDFAVAAQVLRNPLFETLHITFLKGDRVVGHSATTSRVVSAAGLLVGEYGKTPYDLPEYLRDRMAELGADGWAPMHNHPSGDSTPSSADDWVTQAINDPSGIQSLMGRAAQVVPGFKWHVIINSGTYSVIYVTHDQTGKVSGTRIDKNLALPAEYSALNDPILAPDKWHPLLGEEIAGPKGQQKFAVAAHRLPPKSPNHITVLWLDGSSKIREAGFVSGDWFRGASLTEVADRLRDHGRSIGAQYALAVAGDAATFARLDAFSQAGILLDAALYDPATGDVTTGRHPGVGSDTWFGEDVSNLRASYSELTKRRIAKRGGGPAVRETAAGYGGRSAGGEPPPDDAPPPTEPPPDENLPDLMGEASRKPSDIVDKIATFWKAGLLSRPATHIMNVGGNITMGGMESAKDPAAMVFDRLIGLYTKRVTKSPSFRGLFIEPPRHVGGTIGEGWRSAREAQKRLGARKAIQSWLTGKGDPADAAKWDIQQSLTDNPWIAAYQNVVFKPLGAMDALFRSAALGRTLTEHARVQLLERGLKPGTAEFGTELDALISDPPDELMHAALEDAIVATFQNDNALSDWISKHPESFQDSFWGKLALNLIMPFVKTPTNVAARFIDYSPYGFVSAIAKQAGHKFKGQPFDAKQQRRFADDLGRATVGSGWWLAGFSLAAVGLMTGEPANSSSERQQDDVEGRVPWAVKMGDWWVPVHKLSPAGAEMALGAAMFYQWQGHGARGKEGGSRVGATAATGLSSTLKIAADQTFVKGVVGAYSAASDVTKGGLRMAEQTAGSAVPAWVAAIARGSDPKIRDTESITDVVKGRVPGIRESLGARKDALGRDVTKPGGVAGALKELLDPFGVRKSRETDVTKEARRLGIELTGPTPAVRDTALPVGVERPRTKTERRAYLADVGPRVDTMLTTVIQMAAYRELPDELQREFFESVVSRTKATGSARDLARRGQPLGDRDTSYTDARSVVEDALEDLAVKEKAGAVRDSLRVIREAVAKISKEEGYAPAVIAGVRGGMSPGMAKSGAREGQRTQREFYLRRWAEADAKGDADSGLRVVQTALSKGISLTVDQLLSARERRAAVDSLSAKARRKAQ